MIAILPYNGFKRTVYVDGIRLPLQLPKDPKIVGNILVVDCYCDWRMKQWKPEKIPHQIRPHQTFKFDNDITIVRLWFYYDAFDNFRDTLGYEFGIYRLLDWLSSLPLLKSPPNHEGGAR